MTDSTEPANHISALERVLSAIFIVVLLLGALATAGVMFSGMPPLFNQKASIYNVANVLCLLALVAIAATLAITSLRQRWHAARRVLLVVLLTLSTLEALLFFFDRYFISASGSPMEWAFRNVWIHGDPVWLRQPSPGSPFGFRNAPVSPSEKSDYHVLLLGNSFVSGSGTTFATNYPQVLNDELRKAMPGRNINVMSAGVDGFAPKENRLIYEYLLDKGYKFDLVVVNFNLGSDLTGDVPGTFRKSVAGEPQRFPENWFLDQFYPIDTYLFRYAYYFEITFNPRFGTVDAGGPKDATCKATGNFISYSRQRTWLYYGPDASKRVYFDHNLDEVFTIQDVARAHGAKTVMILLPDRYAVLPIPDEEPGDKVLDRSWTRHYLKEKVGDRLPVFDLTPYFENRPDLFACNDLHWSDPGNVEGARLVAGYLVKFLNGAPDAGSTAALTP